MKSLPIAIAMVSLLCACASHRPDHFYILEEEPAGERAPRTVPSTQVTLAVTLPSLVDRSEMIVNTSAGGVSVLEHERWAAPLPDLFVQILGQDIERRRSDLIVGGRSLSGAGSAPIRIAVDVVEVSVRRADRARIEAHWHILQAAGPTVAGGTDVIGSDTFSVPLGGNDYDAVALSLSKCVALLADSLVGQLPNQ